MPVSRRGPRRPAARAVRALLSAGAVTLTLVAPAGAQAPPAGPLTLDAAIERALAANPAIVAARLGRAATAATVDVARERPNPEFRVEIERESPTRAYSLAVPWETGGKRDRRIAVSEAAVGVSEAELTRTALDVRTSVRRAYFGRLVAESRLSLMRELQDLTVRARDAAQQRFDAGSAPRLELLQAELGRADAENQTVGAEGAVAAARAQLNALLALPPDADFALATPLDVAPPATAADSIGRARATNAEIAVVDRRLDAQRARVALAAALRVPDVTPEVSVTRGALPEFSTGWRAGLSVAVPIFTQHRAGERLEDAALAQLAAERDATVARVTGDVLAAAAVTDAQRRQYLRYRDEIVPQAAEVEQLAEDSYRLGRTGIAAYLQALQASRDVRLRTVQAAADYQAARAELERAIGAPLP